MLKIMHTINFWIFGWIVYAFVNIVQAVQINYVKIPNAAKNNSRNAVVLDCNYSVRPDDVDLIVKWLLNDEVVYQWIPPQKPQSLGLLKNRIDLTHKASDDPKTVFSSLKIWNPTTDIAGEYKCFVSTFADEDFRSKNMIVFEPEHSLLILKEEPQSNYINFTCFANKVYPAPKLLFYKDKTDNFHKNPIQTLEWNTSKHPNGRFSVFIVATTLLETLNPGSLIYCELRIPGTGYVKKKSLLYYPSVSQKDCGQSANNGSCGKFILVLLLIILFVTYKG